MTQNIQLKNEKFDGLADNYDRYRPRYPLSLFEIMLLPFKDKKHLSIVDIGAGTGIALEGIVKLLGKEHQYHAIDVSTDMIKKGQKNFLLYNGIKAQLKAYCLKSVKLILLLQRRHFSGWIALYCLALSQTNLELELSWL